MRTAAVVPAYNEATRIHAVLEAIGRAELVDECIAVSDGSTDGTYAEILSHPDVKAVELPHNQGKAAAMWAGVQQTDAPVLLFLDADLQGLQPSQVDDLLRPVLKGEAVMSLGVFRGGRFLTDLAQVLVPYISGQRAMTREFFLSVPNVQSVRYGVEVALARHATRQHAQVKRVLLAGVTHPMKEEKLGALRGVSSRLRMYYEILRFLLSWRRG
ncbi:MAG TPA: glycosyltransferase family 2 protein [Armatimonadota bacterium]